MQWLNWGSNRTKLKVGRLLEILCNWHKGGQPTRVKIYPCCCCKIIILLNVFYEMLSNPPRTVTARRSSEEQELYLLNISSTTPNFTMAGEWMIFSCRKPDKARVYDFERDQEFLPSLLFKREAKEVFFKKIQRSWCDDAGREKQQLSTILNQVQFPIMRGHFIFQFQF